MQKKTRSECHGDAPCDSSKRGPGGDDMERWPPRSYHPTWKQTWKQTPNISTKWGGYVIEYPPEAWHEKVLWNVPKTIQNPIGSCSNPCFRRAVKLLGVYCKLDLPPPHPGCNREKWRFREPDSPFTETCKKIMGTTIASWVGSSRSKSKKVRINDFRGIFGDVCSCFEGTCQVSVLQMKVGVLNCDIECWKIKFLELRCWCSIYYLTSCHLFFGVSQMCQWCPFLGMCWSILLRLGEQLRIGNVEDWKLDLAERFQP